MEYKTSELIDNALDAAVGIALGMEINMISQDGIPCFSTYQCNFDCGPSINESGDIFEPSVRWDHGGPIIESERISLEFYGRYWGAMPKDENGFEIADLGQDKHRVMASNWCPVMATGETPLIAAMRGFVALKLGDEVSFLKTKKGE